MRENLFKMLACPECKSDLNLTIVEGDLVSGVVKGSLTCKGCGTVYPIEEKIPRLLPKKFAEKKSLNNSDNINVVGETNE